MMMMKVILAVVMVAIVNGQGNNQDPEVQTVADGPIGADAGPGKKTGAHVHVSPSRATDGATGGAAPKASAHAHKSKAVHHVNKTKTKAHHVNKTKAGASGASDVHEVTPVGTNANGEPMSTNVAEVVESAPKTALPVTPMDLQQDKSLLQRDFSIPTMKKGKDGASGGSGVAGAVQRFKSELEVQPAHHVNETKTKAGKKKLQKMKKKAHVHEKAAKAGPTSGNESESGSAPVVADPVTPMAGKDGATGGSGVAGAVQRFKSELEVQPAHHVNETKTKATKKAHVHETAQQRRPPVPTKEAKDRVPRQLTDRKILSDLDSIAAPATSVPKVLAIAQPISKELIKAKARIQYMKFMKKMFDIQKMKKKALKAAKAAPTSGSESESGNAPVVAAAAPASL